MVDETKCTGCNCCSLDESDMCTGCSEMPDTCSCEGEKEEKEEKEEMM
jgi:hypothetical protein